MVVRVGDGFCRPAGCDISTSSCRVNGYSKDGSNYHECKTECLNELTCVGFSISNGAYAHPNRCIVYGTVSSKVGWSSEPNNYFDIQTTSGGNGVDCYKKPGNVLCYLCWHSDLEVYYNKIEYVTFKQNYITCTLCYRYMPV